jgi:putative membrane protein insertion efficiency factor
MLSFYKQHISPLYHAIGHSIFGGNFACRFTPTCSEYARQAFSVHGIIRGALLSIYRIMRCQPFCKGGDDPVPPQKTLRAVKIK